MNETLYDKLNKKLGEFSSTIQNKQYTTCGDAIHSGSGKKKAKLSVEQRNNCQWDNL